MLSFTDFDLRPPVEYFLRLRIARNVLFIHLLCAGTTYSQRTFSSFGPTIDLSLDYTPIGFARSSLSEIAVLAQETPSVYGYRVDTNGAFVQTERITLSSAARAIVSDVNSSKAIPELCVLSADGDRLSIIRHVNNAVEQNEILVPTASQQIAYADINNDKRLDVLLYGKKRTGIDVLLRKKDGTYVSGPLLFPDISIVDLKSADLNGDGITDLFVLDWLNNHLALFYGIGRGIFSEQVEINLPGEPAEIALSAVTKERTVRIAVSMPDEKLVSMFMCNATGEIEPSGTLKFPTAPKRVEFGDVNGDRILDLVVTTGQAAYVFPGQTTEQLGYPIPFGAGSGIVTSTLADLDGDSKIDLALIDRLGKRLVLCVNARWSSSIDWPRTYAVGSAPKGIVVTDVNGDGLLDVVVTNSGSSTLSILLNRGQGMLDAQQAVSVAENPFTLKTARGESARGRTAVVSHSTVDKVSIVKCAENLQSSNVFTLPTGSNPYVVLARQDSGDGQLELLVRYTNSQEGSMSLSLFKQISGGQFLERSLRPTLRGQITALTVDDYSRTGTYELAFVTHDKPAKQSTLSVAISAQGFDFKTVKQVLSFPDSMTSVRSIVSGYVDDDLYKDIVLFMSPPKSGLGIVYGRGEGVFSDSLEIIRNIQPLNEDALILRDVDGDGHVDITWLDAGGNAVVTMYGRGNRRFAPPVTICSATRITAIQIESMKSSNSRDLILANGMKGSISIMFDPFRK